MRVKRMKLYEINEKEMSSEFRYQMLLMAESKKDYVSPK